MLKNFIIRLIGCDTVAVRSFNVAQSVVVLAALALHILGVTVAFPGVYPGQFPLLFISTSITLVFGLLSFCKFHVMRARMFGAVSLLMGVITNVGIAGYAYNDFPPFDTLLISAPLLAIWYLLAFMFIFEVEGYDVSAMD